MEKQQNSWSRLTKHARECVLEDRQELKWYQSEEGNVVLFFDCVHNLIGAAFPHEYIACQRFDKAQKALANKWKCHAYDKLEGISPDFILKGNIPEPISSSTDVAAAPCILSVGASQPIFSANQLSPYQGTGAAQNLPYGKHVMGQIYPTTNCDPTITEGLNTHFYQGTVTNDCPLFKILESYLYVKKYCSLFKSQNYYFYLLTFVPSYSFQKHLPLIFLLSMCFFCISYSDLMILKLTRKWNS